MINLGLFQELSAGSGSGEETDGSDIPIDSEDETPPVVSSENIYPFVTGGMWGCIHTHLAGQTISETEFTPSNFGLKIRIKILIPLCTFLAHLNLGLLVSL